jgi:hypothetical protein
MGDGCVAIPNPDRADADDDRIGGNCDGSGVGRSGSTGFLSPSVWSSGVGYGRTRRYFFWQAYVRSPISANPHRNSTLTIHPEAPPGKLFRIRLEVARPILRCYSSLMRICFDIMSEPRSSENR